MIMITNQQLEEIIKVLDFYANEQHFITIAHARPCIVGYDLQAEQEKAKVKGFVHVIEYSNGSEEWVENGTQAQKCLDMITNDILWNLEKNDASN